MMFEFITNNNQPNKDRMSLNSNTTPVQSPTDITSEGGMAEPLTTTAAAIEIANAGFGIYGRAKEFYKSINTQYGELGISFTLILK